MTIYTEGNTLSDLLLSEVKTDWSRETGILADQGGNDLPMGTVLAKVAGKYQPINFAGAGDEKVAVAVLAEGKKAVDADTKAVLLRRGCIVNSTLLVWPAGATDVQKAEALDALDLWCGIVARTPL